MTDKMLDSEIAKINATRLRLEAIALVNRLNAKAKPESVMVDYHEAYLSLVPFLTALADKIEALEKLVGSR